MIEYPVDSESRWAEYSVEKGEVTIRNQAWKTSDGMERPGLDPDIVMLLHVEGTRPGYDHVTQRLEPGEVVDLEANTITRTWEAVDLERVALAANTRSAQRRAMREMWESLPYDYLVGPYEHLLNAAEKLVDRGREGAVLAMLDTIVPTEEILADPEKMQVFENVKGGFAQALANLTPLPE